MGRRFRAKLGYMPQQQTLYPGFTCERFLYYMASLRGMSKARTKERVGQLLGLLALEEVRGKPTRALSGGMKQRLLLAQAMLDDPDILVLDEPTAGLDPRQRIVVRNLIASVALHKIVLLSTHVVPDVEYIARELVLIGDGTVVCQDTPQNLCGAMEGKVWDVEVEEQDLDQMGQYGLVSSLRRSGDGVAVRLIADAPPPYPSRTVEPTLEDVYLHTFGDEGGLSNGRFENCGATVSSWFWPCCCAWPTAGCSTITPRPGTLPRCKCSTPAPRSWRRWRRRCRSAP